MAGNLLNESHKIALSAKVGVLTRALYLSPANESGINVCQFATDGCRAACLGHSSGFQVFSTHKAARIRKTQMLFRDRVNFFAALRKDIDATIRKAERDSVKVAIRLNGSSDVPWEKLKTDRAESIMREYPNVQFYDYTKSIKRALASKTTDWPANYHLTFSRSGFNDAECAEYLAVGGNVAAVFATEGEFPTEYMGAAVVSGEEHDYRVSDPAGSIVALKARGKATSDTSGFVIRA